MLKTNLLRLSFLLGATTLALAEGQGKGEFKANLTGYSEIPAVVTSGTGQLTVTPSSDQKSLNITLNFANLVGVAQTASLYLGLPGTTGGVVAPICGGTQPACPTSASGTVTVTLAAADIVAIAAQGLAAGDIASVIQAMASGALYVNLATDKFATGEIRGQLGRGLGLGHSDH